ncbi:transposon Ty3-I Gag-Pol polyprotein [Trichonephila clavipes]|nr:transposon Ty3-I Gag-Pol polyprotein [Trichonephila clavipes]
MAHVDALSRPPHCMLIRNSVHIQFLKAQQADDQITALKTLLETTPHRLGSLATTSKKYKYAFAVIDTFSKFTWLYPTRSTDAAEAINRLKNQRHVFGNPARIITDKGSAFTSSAFEDYCKRQNILHISITNGLPRSNGQIKKQNSTIIAVLSKLSVDDPEKWYSHVPHL